MRRFSLVIAIGVLALWGTGYAGPVPRFSQRTLEGKRFDLSKELERGPVLIDFWATYCKPCLKAMPKLEQLHKKYGPSGLTVVGINEDGPRNLSKVRPFLRRLAISYPIVIDADGSLMHKFRAPGCPTAVLISKDSEVVLQQSGYYPGQDKALIEAIERELGFQSERAVH